MATSMLNTIKMKIKNTPNKSRITTTDDAIAEWQSIAEFLNKWIASNGQIQINNHELWQEYLHRWDNEDWQAIIEAMGELYQRNPEYFQDFHKQAMARAASVLISADRARVLDTKAHKKTAWKMIMTMREVWNNVNDIDLPNENIRVNRFSKLFAFND
jgi:hypothetical protein